MFRNIYFSQFLTTFRFLNAINLLRNWVEKTKTIPTAPLKA